MRINILRLIERGLDFVLAGIPTEVDILQKRLERLDELSKKLEETETRKAIEEASKIEDVEAAIEHLKQAAKKLACPICRALHYHMIDYLMYYDAITRLKEEGVKDSEIDKVFKERFEPQIRRKLEQIKRELLIDDYSLRESRGKFVEMLKNALS